MELAKRLKQGNAFVTRVLAQPKIWLVGGENDFAKPMFGREGGKVTPTQPQERHP